VEYTDPIRAVHDFLYSSEEEVRIVERKNSARDYLKKELLSLGTEDETGSILWEFDNPLSLKDTYTGLKLQRRVSESLNDDRALEIIRKYDLEDRCIIEVVTEEIDYDELYAANQERLVADDEIDSIIESTVTYALVKVK
jgi:hypothetical protein